MAKYDGTNWIVYNASNSSLPFNFIKSISIGNNDFGWIGGNGGGLVKFDGTNSTYYNTSDSPLPNSMIHSVMIDDKATKWIGTDGGGLIRLDSTNWSVITYNGIPSNISTWLLTVWEIFGWGMVGAYQNTMVQILHTITHQIGVSLWMALKQWKLITAVIYG